MCYLRAWVENMSYESNDLFNPHKREYLSVSKSLILNVDLVTKGQINDVKHPL